MPKTSSLPAQNDPAGDDVFPSDDVSTTNKDTKKLTLNALVTWLRKGNIPTHRNTIYKTTSGTYAKPSGMTANGFVIVEVIGGGGGSAGAGSTGGGEASESTGGGGGEYAKGRIEAASLSASETVTVGAAGAGVLSPSTANGGNGGTSSFGAHITALGGTGGTYMAGTGSNIYNQGSGGGTGGTGGQLRIRGGKSGPAVVDGGSTFPAGRFNFGGTSFLTNILYPDGGATTGDAQTGLNYGGGASGSRNGSSSSFRAGANGAPGIVIIHEYY